jgi:TatA/E family protein of Tat protein translocase
MTHSRTPRSGVSSIGLVLARDCSGSKLFWLEIAVAREEEAFVFGLGGPEIIIVLALGLMLFGAKKLPELGKGLGSGLREFKRSVSDLRGDLEGSLQDEPRALKPDLTERGV